MVGVDSWEMVVLVPPGLEPALVAELKALGLEAQPDAGAARVRGGLDALVHIHTWSRLAIRVLVRLGRVRARTLDELATGLRSMPWKSWVIPSQPIEVEVTLSQSKLRRDTVPRKVELAITDALRGPRLPGPRPPREPATVHVRIQGDHAEISVDASGERLTVRGWREATAKAPLRENLGAAMLQIAGWDGAEPLVDPMCGSGTLIIEGARRAAGLPPRLSRVYAWERFPLAVGRRHAEPPQPVATGMLLGFDRDAGAVRSATSNADRARVGQRVRFAASRFDELEPPAPAGLLVANPPWGLRIGDGEQVPFRRWGALLRDRWSGWRAAWLVPQTVGPRELGWGKVAARFESGGVHVQVVLGEL